MKPKMTKVEATSSMVHIEPGVRVKLDEMINGSEISYGQAIRAILSAWSQIDEIVKDAERKGYLQRGVK